MIGLQDQLASFKRPYVPVNSANVTGRSDANHGARLWQQLIDEQQIEWGRHREQFDEAGVKPPTAEALARACEFAMYCRDRQTDPPLRAAPDGSGGITFEWQADPAFQTVEINDLGKTEMLSFENSKLMLRLPIG
jgi:hypothetical protein